jgi:Glycosyltransferase family 28 C-terminal domain
MLMVERGIPECRRLVMHNLTVVFHDAGGGHRSAAGALKTVLEAQDRPWNIRFLNLQELLEPIDLFHRATGLRIQDGYNLILKKGWTRLTPPLLALLQRTIQLHHSRIVRILRSYWAQNPTDLVLSVIPHFNRCLAQSVRLEIPNAAFVTLLTDLADYPPNFWIVPESEFIICGSQRAKQQALAMGHPIKRVYETSGMILKPSFYRKPEGDRAGERVRLGLQPDLPTGIVMFGGHGSASMLEIAKRLEQVSHRIQLLFLCGHNLELATKLRALKVKQPAVIEGFTTKVDYFMSLADFFVGKPGPGSISEALQFGLPVIVEQNPSTMPQERYNGTWLVEKRMGMAVRDFREVAAAIEQLLMEDSFAEFRRNATNYKNYAIFEIPQILDQIIAEKTVEAMTGVSALASVDPFASVAWAGLT